jgi:hypothetical protein
MRVMGLWCLMSLSTIFQLYHALSHNVVLSKPRLSGIQTHSVSCDRH